MNQQKINQIQQNNINQQAQLQNMNSYTQANQNTQNILTPQNKIFQLNKQLILTCRKLETGPLENYTHMATLIHKVNLLLLEYDSVTHLKNIQGIIFSDKLLNTIIDFCMNTESFANFGIRLLEIFSLEFPQKICRSEIFQVIQGLLRTNDYETVAQCLSFLNVMAHQIVQNELSKKLIGDKMKQNLVLDEIINPKLIVLTLQTVSKTPKQAQIEFVHYALEIVSICILNPILRKVILEQELHGMISLQKEKEIGDAHKIEDSQNLNKEDEPKTTYIHFLKHIENDNNFKSVKKLRQKIIRQRKELEIWLKAQHSKEEQQKLENQALLEQNNNEANEGDQQENKNPEQEEIVKQ